MKLFKTNYMRIIIILLAAIAIYSTAFYRPNCEHVFTEVEQETVTIERPGTSYSTVYPLYSWPSGLQEGKELICVKCFHKQKQILDYGAAQPGFALTDSMLRKLNIIGDTCGVTFPSSGKILLRVADTLFAR